MQPIQVAWPSFSTAVQPLVPLGVQPAAALVPRLDILESPREVVCILEVPGARVQDIKVEFVDQQLVISGSTYSGLQEGEEGLVPRYRERLEGRFQRLVALPARVDVSMAMAGYKEGLLTVRLPKADSGGQEPRRISVSHLD